MSSCRAWRAALVWAQFGPYHYARLAACQLSTQVSFVGVEVAALTTTYAWKYRASNPIVTLCPNAVAEEVSFGEVFFKTLIWLIRSNIDVVFVPSYWPASSLAVLLAAKMAGRTCIMMNETHRLTNKARGWRFGIKFVLVRLFSAALVGGQRQMEYCHYMGLETSRCFSGYDIVEVEYFSREAVKARSEAAATRARLGLPLRYFLNIGRMEVKKDLETLVRAYSRAAKCSSGEFPALVFVGSGSEEAKLRSRCVELGLRVADSSRPFYEADVHFFGFRQLDEIPYFYGLAEAFVLPSVEEEWGLVVNEAMCAGLPILVSEVVGCVPDLVEHGVNGFHFPPRDVETLAAQLRTLAGSARLRAEMGVASRLKINNWRPERFRHGAEAALGAAGVLPGRDFV